MKGQKERTELISRRSMLKGSAAFLVGGTVGCLGDKLSPPAAARHRFLESLFIGIPYYPH